MGDNSTISVPIPTASFIELVDFLREVGSDRDPVETVETAIAYWIDNASAKREDLLPETLSAPPARQNGYMWKRTFLPHGTRLRMAYQREFKYAQVEGDRVLYGDKSVSPGEFANLVGGGSRSAWRDVWIKRPRDGEWLRASELRLETSEGEDE